MSSDGESDSNNVKTGRLVLDDKAVRKELEGLPATKRDQFLVSLELVRQGLSPLLPSEKLHSAGKGVIELKIQGRPAYRCIYTVLANGDVVVLHSTAKTTNGQDRQLVKTAKQRRKRLAPES